MMGRWRTSWPRCCRTPVANGRAQLSTAARHHARGLPDWEQAAAAFAAAALESDPRTVHRLMRRQLVTFDPAWLALREPLDHRSRASALMPLLVDAWRTHRWSRVLDLGSGTGSNLRYLGPQLPGLQEWTLLDRDPELLARVERPEFTGTAKAVQGDLDGQGLAAIPHAHLITGSALLDLVSEDWVERVVAACCRERCGAHFALTYDGQIAWSQPDAEQSAEHDPDDVLIREAVNLHQRRNKGMGSALGPAAGAVADAVFKRAGYRTWLAASPWHLGADDAAAARALVEDWAQAALEVDAPADHGQRVRRWARRRKRTIAHSAFRLTVGHVDLLALPSEP